MANDSRVLVNTMTLINRISIYMYDSYGTYEGDGVFMESEGASGYSYSWTVGSNQTNFRNSRASGCWCINLIFSPVVRHPGLILLLRYRLAGYSS